MAPRNWHVFPFPVPLAQGLKVTASLRCNPVVDSSILRFCGTGGVAVVGAVHVG